MENNIWPDDVAEAAESLGSNWVKAQEFDGEGIVLKFAKPVEKVESRYGAIEGDFLVEQNILKEGQSLRFFFEDAEGQERKFDSKSATFFIGIKNCEDLAVGDWIHIHRTGKGDKTRYAVVKVTAPVQEKSVDIGKDDIPF